MQDDPLTAIGDAVHRLGEILAYLASRKMGRGHRRFAHFVRLALLYKRYM
jgi:hypothetical protein